MIIADGFKGKVFTDPTEEELEEYRTKQAAYLKEKESLNEYFSKETVTKSGVKKHVYGNIGKAEDAQNVLQNGGEGIGLFRTEFLFMDRASSSHGAGAVRSIFNRRKDNGRQGGYHSHARYRRR